MEAEAREAICQGLPVSGGAGRSLSAPVLECLHYPTPPLKGPRQPVSRSQACLQEKPHVAALGQTVAGGLLVQLSAGSHQAATFVPARTGAGVGMGKA